MRAIALTLVCLMLAGCLATEGEVDDIYDGAVEESNGEQKDVCLQHCDGTYPEHTYPSSEDHLACTRGCRLAQVNALIAWPLQSDLKSCIDTCKEGYSPSPQQLYACKLGCNASTIDQMVPDRDHLYPTETNASEAGYIVDILQFVKQQLPQFMVIDNDITELSQHADMMYQLLPCSRVVVIDDGETVEIQYRYGVDYMPLLEDSNYQSSDYLFVQDEPYSSPSSYNPCPWRTMRYSAAGRFLFFTATCLIVAAVVTCCCATCLPQEEEEEEDREKGEKTKVVYPPFKKPYGDDFFIDTSIKSPVTFAAGYPQPVPYSGQKKGLALVY